MYFSAATFESQSENSASTMGEVEVGAEAPDLVVAVNHKPVLEALSQTGRAWVCGVEIFKTRFCERIGFDIFQFILSLGMISKARWQTDRNVGVLMAGRRRLGHQYLFLVKFGEFWG